MRSRAATSPFRSSGWAAVVSGGSARAVARGGPVVDADERRGEVARLVDRDDRQPAGEGGLDARVVGRHRVGEEAVDGGLAYDLGGVVVARRAGDHEEAGLRVLDAG